uniref:Ammonium_transp domain-containing protein n=1 Tax=Bursaphelenchus xylophilus TaxID=6326 RepID=A0A1I7SFB5_BURXY
MERIEDQANDDPIAEGQTVQRDTSWRSMITATDVTIAMCNAFTAIYLCYMPPSARNFEYDEDLLATLGIDLNAATMSLTMGLFAFWVFLVQNYCRGQSRREIANVVFLQFMLIIFGVVFAVHFNAFMLVEDGARVVINLCSVGLADIVYK